MLRVATGDDLSRDLRLTRVPWAKGLLFDKRVYAFANLEDLIKHFK